MFLTDPTTPEAAAYFEKNRAATGYVMNLERAWAWRPDVAEALAALRKQLTDGSTLTPREIALLVCTSIRAVGDSYCSIAWSTRLAELAAIQLNDASSTSSCAGVISTTVLTQVPGHDIILKPT